MLTMLTNFLERCMDTRSAWVDGDKIEEFVYDSDVQ